MIKEFEKLNPMLTYLGNGVHQLVMACPECGYKFSIRINLHGNPISPSIWGLTFPENSNKWSEATISPSIANHPQSRKQPKCNAHFSVIKGRIES